MNILGIDIGGTGIKGAVVGCGFPAAVRDGGRSLQRISRSAGSAAMSCGKDFGAGKDHTGTIRVCTFGTGIGTALCSNGQLVPNTEFGHIEIRGKEAERWGEQKARQISSPARAEQ
jgi:predicted NBD/HSP70 family sugar kinase